MRFFVVLNLLVRKSFYILFNWVYTPIAKILFFLNGVEFGKGLRVLGLIKVFVTRRGRVLIGRHLRINSGDRFNIIGRQQKCILWVEGELIIGDNVGISASAIICNKKVVVEDDVIIGGNTVIYDTDFHSLNAVDRLTREADKANAKCAPVVIRQGAFIGAHATILKGVTIGRGSVVGACSVVTKDVPDKEIWGGNPAVFIRKV